MRRQSARFLPLVIVAAPFLAAITGARAEAHRRHQAGYQGAPERYRTPMLAQAAAPAFSDLSPTPAQPLPRGANDDQG